MLPDTRAWLVEMGVGICAGRAGDRVPVSVSQLKQIAGRAGRRNSEWSVGLATCLNPRDVSRLQKALAVPLEKMSTAHAGLFPEFEHLEVRSNVHAPECSLSCIGVRLCMQ